MFLSFIEGLDTERICCVVAWLHCVCLVSDGERAEGSTTLSSGH